MSGHVPPAFRESDHVGLRADPPALRIQRQRDGGWAILDVDKWVAHALDFEAALTSATELLQRPGVIYVVDELGQITEMRRTEAVSHAPLDPKPPGGVLLFNAGPGTGAVPGSSPMTTKTESARPQDPEIEPESVKSIMGTDWTDRMKAARENESLEALTEGVKEAVHVLHFLHPFLQQSGPLIQAILRAAGH